MTVKCQSWLTCDRILLGRCFFVCLFVCLVRDRLLRRTWEHGARLGLVNAAFKNRCDFRRAAIFADLWTLFASVTLRKTVAAERQMCPRRPGGSLPSGAPDCPGSETEVSPLFPAVPPPCLLLAPCRPETVSETGPNAETRRRTSSARPGRKEK